MSITIMTPDEGGSNNTSLSTSKTNTNTNTNTNNESSGSGFGLGLGSSLLGSRYRRKTTLYYAAIAIALITIGIYMVRLDVWELVDLSTIRDDTRGMVARTDWKTNTTNNNNSNSNSNSNSTGTGKVLAANNNNPITTITNKTITTKNGTVAIATTKTTTTVTTTTAAAAIASEKNVSSQNDTVITTIDDDDTNSIEKQQQQQQLDNNKNNNTDTDTTITFLVQLSGEFGNNLQKIIRGWGVAKLAYEEFGIKSHIVYQEQSRKNGKVMAKARKTTPMIQKCFIKPNFKNVDFHLGNNLYYGKTNYFNQIIPDESSPSSFTVSERLQTINDVRNNLSILSKYIKKNPQVLLKQQNLKDTIYEKENYNASDWTVSSSPLPGIPKGMVIVAGLQETVFVDKYYDLMLKTFIFNDEECCGDDTNNYPHEDESVLHYRNFATEMKLSTRISKGFEELDPKKIAYELFGNLNAGDKIAIAGRNVLKDSQRNDTDIYKVVKELEERNLTVRFAPGKSAVEDFCFLKRAKKELVGTYKSSYVKFASYLGGPSIKLTRLYQYTTYQSSTSDGGLTFRLKNFGNWTNPELLSRIKYEFY